MKMNDLKLSVTEHRNMISVLSVFLIVLCLTVDAQTKSIKKSPQLSEASPMSVGMSPERLARIDVMCEKAVSEGNIPGAIALVARHGKIVYWKAFGMADNQNSQPLKKDDIFRIASMSKSITSTAVMMLWEEGKFQLDDPISKFIPEFKNPQILKSFQYNDTSYTTVPASCEITIRHLLTHTSGLGYGQIDKDERFKMIYQKSGIIDLFTTENINLEENINKLANLPLHHNPGESYTYSIGFEILAYFVETMSGIQYDEFLRTRLFDPLGMNDTWFYLPEEKAERLVSVQYTPEEGKWERYPVTFYDPDFPVKGAKRYFSGGAGLCSTAKDYATFMQMYLNGGELDGIRILSRSTIQTMLSNQIGDLRGNNINRHFGLAFSITNEIGQSEGGMGNVGSLASTGYFNTLCFADQKDEYIGVLMKQTRGTVSDNTGWKFRILLGQAVDD